jgi:hypothetical protein
MCLCVHAHMQWHTSGGQLTGVGSGIELRSSGLVAITFACWAISLPQVPLSELAMLLLSLYFIEAYIEVCLELPSHLPVSSSESETTDCANEELSRRSKLLYSLLRVKSKLHWSALIVTPSHTWMLFQFKRWEKQRPIRVLRPKN